MLPLVAHQNGAPNWVPLLIRQPREAPLTVLNHAQMTSVHHESVDRCCISDRSSVRNDPAAHSDVLRAFAAILEKNWKGQLEKSLLPEVAP